MLRKAFCIIIVLCVVCFTACGSSNSGNSNVQETTTTVAQTTVTAVEETTSVSTATEATEDTTAESEATTTETSSDENTEPVDVAAYFGEMIVDTEEIPTYSGYIESQENAYRSDFKKNDPRRVFFKSDIKKITIEYESDGKYYNEDTDFIKLDEGLFRVNPIHEIVDDEGNPVRNYMTFKIEYSDGGIRYMTWVPAT